MKDVVAIILAAGLGTRMKSSFPKVLHRVGSSPMLELVLEALRGAGIKNRLVVISPGMKSVKKAFPGLRTALQKKPRGSGDAVKCAGKYLSRKGTNVLVACGDAPLIKAATIKKLLKKHKASSASCTILTARLANPCGYGRIVKNPSGDVERITEEKDLLPGEKSIKEINAGLYCFDGRDLFSRIAKIKRNKKKKEYYLTDIVKILRASDRKISACPTDDADEALGINSKADLAKASGVVRKRINEKLMSDGVIIIDPSTAYIDSSAKIGKDTIIHPNTIIEKGVRVGSHCEIGPFARLRPGTIIDDTAEIGNFAELVRTRIGSGTKAKHTCYLGDAVVGKNVNIGAGAITANYDGKKKNKTIIENGAFIGVGAILIAPVKIGPRATVGAGSVVIRNRNVPAGRTVAGVPARVLR